MQVPRPGGVRGDRPGLQERLDLALVDLAHPGGLHPHGPHLHHQGSSVLLLSSREQQL